MTTSLPPADIIAKHDEVAREVLWQIRESYEELIQMGKSVEKDLAKLTSQKLVRLGFLAMAGTKNIFAEFNSAIDLVAWKSSYALGVAVVLDHCATMGSDRMQQLDEFAPPMRLKHMPVLKLYVDLQGNTPFTRPSSLGEAYVWGRHGQLTPSPVFANSAPGAKSANDEDSPF